jgi:hypothetical protein
MRPNHSHLIDQSCQHRVTLMFPSGLDLLNFSETASLSWIYCVEFVHTWKNEQEPSRLDCYITGQISGGATLTIAARIVPAHYAIGDQNAPNMLDDGTGTTTSATDADIIDETTSIDSERFASAHVPLLVAESSEFVTATVAIMRLEVTMHRSDTDEDGQINRILVREYC